MGNRTDLIVDFFVFEDAGEPSIFGVHGMVTMDELQDIKRQFCEDYRDIDFGNDGNYKIRCGWFPGQYDELSRCELSPYWEFELIEYKPIEYLSDGGEE